MAAPKFYPCKTGDHGSHVEGYGRAMARALEMLKWWGEVPPSKKRTWGWHQKHLANKIKKLEGDRQDGLYDKKLHWLLVDQQAFDALAIALINGYHPADKLPDLGPLYKGGKSVLDQAPTHDTSGLTNYSAFDDAFLQGLPILAPENLTVTRESSSRPGDAFYAQGASTLRYWFGHLAVAPAVGRKFAKGQVVGVVGANNIGGGPHVHLGVNIENLVGFGRRLAYGRTGSGPDYTWGSATIRVQLARLL